MKRKFILFLLIFVSVSAVNAQTGKTAVYDKIESSYAWINYEFLNRSATLNFTDEQWNYALKNQFVGLQVINNLGNNMASFFEKTADNRLIDDCRYGKDKAACEKRVAAFANTLKVEANFQQLQMSPERFKLAMYALNTIGNFLGSNNIYGGNAGWKPKASSLKIILNIDNGTGQPTVTWNNDFTVATVKMFVGAEAGDWSANIMKGLEKGGTK